MQTQMWRSSWSGPRGYSNWAYTSVAYSDYVSEDWGIGCNNGKGTYTYYPVMKGWSATIGTGPTVKSSNSLRYDCGTTP
jgi:hypothetical protein